MELFRVEGDGDIWDFVEETLQGICGLIKMNLINFHEII